MLWLDIKYANLVSFKLPKFKPVGNNTFNFRCPICGDSKKNKNKTRGYLYPVKNDHLLFHCHNCNASYNIENFLKEIDSHLYDEYVREKLKNKFFGKSRIETPVGINLLQKDISKVFVPKFLKDSPLKKLIKVSSLPANHPAKKYVQKRNIPSSKHYKIFFALHFKEWVNSFIPEKFKDYDTDEPRLILPFIDTDGSFIGVSARALTNIDPKYYTIYFDKDRPRIFGLDSCDLNKKVYITEGPIDSLFLPNSIALMGLNINEAENLRIKKENKVFVFDNQPRNPDVCRIVEKVINLGYNVFIWPSYMDCKDINDLALSGMTERDIQQYIDTNTFKNLEANLKFHNWKKITL